MSQSVRRTIRFAHASAGESFDPEAVAVQAPMDRDWAWGRATGRGVRVCLVDSGVAPDHPLVSGVSRYTAVRGQEDDPGTWSVIADTVGDSAGHGTACASIIRTLAPDCELTSVRILGNGLLGNGDAFLAAIEWAVDRRFPLVNLSLSTRSSLYKEKLRDLADQAYFAGTTLVAAAHNSPVDSYPWRFPSVISVGAHDTPDPEHLESNPTPPVDLFAFGVDVPVVRTSGGLQRVSGNSFAAPHVTGLCARILELHPRFRTPQLRHVLTATANNIVPRRLP